MTTMYKRKSISFIVIFVLIILFFPMNSIKASETVMPKKITVKNYLLDMTVGSKQILDTKVTPSSADDTVEISSSDNNVVYVNNDQKRLTAILEGKAKITVSTFNKKKFSFTITVYPKETKIVTTETQLKAALKTMKSGNLVLSSTKKVNITIPTGKYKKINLYIDLPEGTFINKGTFKSVNNELSLDNTSRYTDESVFETIIKDNSITITGIRDKSIAAIKIPSKIGGNKVTAIADNAFLGCKKLRNIIIPEGVRTIAPNAFYGCVSLTDITIPSSITDIDNSAFKNCKKLKYIYLPDKLNSSLTWLRRYESEEMVDIYEVIDADMTRWGMWDLTYKEFIEIYSSIGTDDDLFLKMLKEKGSRHTDPTIWFDYDGMPGVEIKFNDVLTEKIYALHYAPFEYNSEDLLSGNYAKDNVEAYKDHGGVCSILAHTYGHFIYNILGETDWQYAYYSNDEVGHEVLIVKTEDGKCFQIDNCGVDYWWLGIETIPDMQKIDNYIPDYEWEVGFYQQKTYLNTSKELLWFDFAIGDYDFDKEEWKNRSIWYDYNTKDWNAYIGYSTPKYYVCNYVGLDKIISMAGHAKLDGYIDIDELKFSKP